jgi:hypothetical protein
MGRSRPLTTGDNSGAAWLAARLLLLVVGGLCWAYGDGHRGDLCWKTWQTSVAKAKGWMTWEQYEANCHRSYQQVHDAIDHLNNP